MAKKRVVLTPELEAAMRRLRTPPICSIADGAVALGVDRKTFCRFAQELGIDLSSNARNLPWPEADTTELIRLRCLEQATFGEISRRLGRQEDAVRMKFNRLKNSRLQTGSVEVGSLHR